ncbi:MAG: DNA polymerase IV [Phycisphaeraceae bacterium]|nr:MAG: DNA polymerase IV [Phycisphaeraceae bacterium]
MGYHDLPPLRALFLDLNSFYASVEQQLNPDLRGKPVGVIPVEAEGTCCIAASYEAKAKGVRTGTGVREARQLCPDIRFVTAVHRRYIEMHHKIIEAVEQCAPVWGVHSIDEMSARLSLDERTPERAAKLARGVKQEIYARAGEWMRCSVGVAPNRWLAKVATGMQKPDGLVVLEAKDVRDRLGAWEVDELCGIASSMKRRLAARGILTVADLYDRPERELREIWGGLPGARWYHQLRGGPDWYDVPTRRGMIGHQHVFAPKYRTPEGARAVAVRLLQKAAIRLRAMGYHATQLSVSVRLEGGGHWEAFERFEPARDVLTLQRVLVRAWSLPDGVTPVQAMVVFTGLVPDAQVPESLWTEPGRLDRLSDAIDRLTSKHGHAAVYCGSMHAAKHAAPRRIAFGTVPDLALKDEEEPWDGKGRAGSLRA